MFSYLKGILAHKSNLSIIIDCNGVGYDVNIPLSTYDNLPPKGEMVKVFIHFSMSDEGIRLFGFVSEAERSLFRELISISRIGPKIGLSILSGMTVDDFVQAIVADNTNLISTIPGIGKKSAQRLIIELKDKVGKIKGSSINLNTSEITNNILEEAHNALLTLGYSKNNVAKVINRLRSEKNIQTSEELIKLSIKELYKLSKK